MAKKKSKEMEVKGSDNNTKTNRQIKSKTNLSKNVS